MTITIKGIEELKKSILEEIKYYAKQDMYVEFINAIDYYSKICWLTETREVETFEEYYNILNLFENYQIYNSGTYIELSHI